MRLPRVWEWGLGMRPPRGVGMRFGNGATEGLGLGMLKI